MNRSGRRMRSDMNGSDQTIMCQVGEWLNEIRHELVRSDNNVSGRRMRSDINGSGRRIRSTVMCQVGVGDHT